MTEALRPYYSHETTICGIPPGGAVLAAQIARIFKAPFRIIVAETFYHPYDPAISIGAVASDGHYIKNSLDEIYLDQDCINREIASKQLKAKEYERFYGKLCRLNEIRGKNVVLVDDHIESGLTFSLAISELFHCQPKKIIAVIPVVPFIIAERIKDSVHLLISLKISMYNSENHGVYRELSSISHEEAVNLLEKINNHWQ